MAGDEGLVWFDARGQRAGATGTGDAPGAFTKELKIDEEDLRGTIRAAISNERVAAALRQLDEALAIGIALVAIAGGLIIATISTRSVERVQHPASDPLTGEHLHC